MKFNKKGVMWPYLMAAIIALVVVILVIMWFRTGAGKGYDIVEEKLEGLGDSDGDGVADMFDKCENTPKGVEVDSNGCSETQMEGLE